MKAERNAPSRARNVEERRFTAPARHPTGAVENVVLGGHESKTGILDQGPGDMFNLGQT
jgi:hypothetical protein